MNIEPLSELDFESTLGKLRGFRKGLTDSNDFRNVPKPRPDVVLVASMNTTGIRVGAISGHARVVVAEFDPLPATVEDKIQALAISFRLVGETIEAVSSPRPPQGG